MFSVSFSILTLGTSPWNSDFDSYLFLWDLLWFWAGSLYDFNEFYLSRLKYQFVVALDGPHLSWFRTDLLTIKEWWRGRLMVLRATGETFHTNVAQPVATFGPSTVRLTVYTFKLPLYDFNDSTIALWISGFKIQSSGLGTISNSLRLWFYFVSGLGNAGFHRCFVYTAS